MVKKAGVIVTLAALIGMILLCRAGSGMLRERIAEGRKVSARPESREGCLVIIDPGHGGLDAGKIGVNGKEEKEINLNISLKIQKLLKEQGVEVEMTRTEDERLGETQVEDLKARVSLMNEKNPDLVISIHQNSYHEESVSGAQVFYYTDSAQSIGGRCLLGNIDTQIFFCPLTIGSRGISLAYGLNVQTDCCQGKRIYDHSVRSRLPFLKPVDVLR